MWLGRVGNTRIFRRHCLSERGIMAFSRHLKLLLLTSLGWVLFVIIGWPSYYQAWSFKNLLYFCVAVYFAVGLAIYSMVKRYSRNCLAHGLWVAFYITVPLICYDYIYITFVRIEPFELSNRFWFLSVFYIIPWFQALLLYLYIETNKTRSGVWGLLGLVFLAISVILRSQWATFEGSFFDTMSNYPEGNVTMLGSALRYAIYGTLISASTLSFVRFVKNVNK